MSEHKFYPNSLLNIAAATLLKRDGCLTEQVPRTLRRCLRWDWFLSGIYTNQTGQTGWDSVRLEPLLSGARVTLAHGPHFYTFEVPYVASIIRSGTAASLLGVSQNVNIIGQTFVSLACTKIRLCASRRGCFNSEICFEVRYVMCSCYIYGYPFVYLDL